MPTFDYRCKDCTEVFEVLLRTRTQKVTCPRCRSRKVEKQVSGFRLNLGATPGGPPMGGTCTCGSGNCAP